MKILIAAALLCTGIASAEGPADRTAIETVINSLKTAAPVSTLFTADADSDLAQLKAVDSAMADSAKQPWSEKMTPRLLIDSVRFLTPDIALVQAAETQIGSVMVRRVPVQFVMKKETGGWKIASLKLLSASGLV
jgi:hypothetical protein